MPTYTIEAFCISKEFATKPMGRDVPMWVVESIADGSIAFYPERWSINIGQLWPYGWHVSRSESGELSVRNPGYFAGYTTQVPPGVGVAEKEEPPGVVEYGQLEITHACGHKASYPIVAAGAPTLADLTRCPDCRSDWLDKRPIETPIGLASTVVDSYGLGEKPRKKCVKVLLGEDMPLWAKRVIRRDDDGWYIGKSFHIYPFGWYIVSDSFGHHAASPQVVEALASIDNQTAPSQSETRAAWIREKALELFAALSAQDNRVWVVADLANDSLKAATRIYDGVKD